MILLAIRDRLESSTELKAIVDEKIFPVYIPQEDPAPAVAFNAVSQPKKESRSGSDMSDNTVEILCLSKTYQQAADMGRIIELLFRNWSKVYTNDRVLGSQVDSISRTYNAQYDEYQMIINITLHSKTI